MPWTYNNGQWQITGEDPMQALYGSNGVPTTSGGNMPAGTPLPMGTNPNLLNQNQQWIQLPSGAYYSATTGQYYSSAGMPLLTQGEIQSALQGGAPTAPSATTQPPLPTTGTTPSGTIPTTQPVGGTPPPAGTPPPPSGTVPPPATTPGPPAPGATFNGTQTPIRTGPDGQQWSYSQILDALSQNAYDQRPPGIDTPEKWAAWNNEVANKQRAQMLDLMYGDTQQRENYFNTGGQNGGNIFDEILGRSRQFANGEYGVPDANITAPSPIDLNSFLTNPLQLSSTPQVNGPQVSGLSPEAVAAMRSQAIENVPGRYQQQQQDLMSNMMRRGLYGGDTPAAGEAARMFGNLAGMQEQDRAQQLQNIDLAQEDARRQAEQLNAGYNMQGQLANQGTWMQGALANQQTGLQGQQANLQAYLQAALPLQGMQYDSQLQNYNLNNQAAMQRANLAQYGLSGLSSTAGLLGNIYNGQPSGASSALGSQVGSQQFSQNQQSGTPWWQTALTAGLGGLSSGLGYRIGGGNRTTQP